MDQEPSKANKPKTRNTTVLFAKRIKEKSTYLLPDDFRQLFLVLKN